jgi:pyruvate decarboxylase
MLTPENVVLAETGDSWFNCQKLRLPAGCGFEFQMQYGSIGWAVGATLGYAQAAGKDKRVISCIGDGSFQVKLGNRMPPKSAVECFRTL